MQQGSQPLRWDSLTQQIQVKAPIWVAQRQTTARARADSLSIVSDFQRQLQRLANGYPFNAPYRYLLTKYLAQQPPSAVLANGMPQRDFYSYCMGLHLVKGWQIDSVAVSRKPNTGRVTKLSVVQHQAP
ncbi:hypothetical protein [Hymenobacter sp. UV11]|uniref:hypothetical protein n=1 Tax=Hymenobacter sp. UV11 TaxID=1849735 RepID=UPI001F1046A0|nr:hypothetical protein [Hymenobacter sp. UV11]